MCHEDRKGCIIVVAKSLIVNGTVASLVIFCKAQYTIISMGKRPGTQRPAVRDREHDGYVSTVKFTNVKKVEKQAELLNLLTNIIKQHSKKTAVLIQAKTSANIIEYKVTRRRVAEILARKVQESFKHNHPEITITEPKDRSFCNIVVNFN